MLEEFDVTYKYKEGHLNLIADAISRILTSHTVREEQSVIARNFSITWNGVYKN